jgi:endonuclease III
MSIKIAEKCRKIADEYGQRYKEEIMDSDRWTPQLLSNDWFLSLEFWFNKSFFRGRLDSISENFKDKALSVIKDFGKEKLFDISNEEIEKALLKAGVNNHIDRKMVIQTLEFIRNLNAHNIVTHCLSKIEKDQTKESYDELQKIYGIGSKLASLFLRDICFIYMIDLSDKEQLICLQPVDTWVKQVAVKLGIPGCTQKMREIDVVEPIVSYCLQNKISPLLFNAGAWYIGARSFDLLIELI